MQCINPQSLIKVLIIYEINWLVFQYKMFWKTSLLTFIKLTDMFWKTHMFGKQNPDEPDNRM